MARDFDRRRKRIKYDSSNKKKKGTQIKYKKVVVVFSHGKVVYTRAPTKNVVFTTRIEQNVSQ
jgi:hypothetical protein